MRYRYRALERAGSPEDGEIAKLFLSTVKRKRKENGRESG